jgi:predicted DsbA family dithiol-disulfide isomerase/uncharacterized membrane protein
MNRPAFYSTIAASAAALVASASLLVDYVRTAPVFCGDGGGCGLVKRTVLAYPLGIPMPVFGVVGMLTIALLALVPGRRARIAQAMAGVFGGIVAAGLLAVQAAMGVICPFCAVVDTAALVLAALSILRALKGWDPPASRTPMIASVGVAILSIGVPLGVGFAKKAPPVPIIGVPDMVRAEIAKTPPGKLTVIDFADYECPFCRATHARLAPLLAENKDRVRLVHKNVPLRMHPHAAEAARAACCGEQLGKGDEISEALFHTEPSELTREGCEKIAQEHGLDITKFRSCVADPATEASIKADTEALRDSEPDHRLRLPTIWVGAHKLQGEQDDASLREAFASASRAL